MQIKFKVQFIQKCWNGELVPKVFYLIASNYACFSYFNIHYTYLMMYIQNVLLNFATRPRMSGPHYGF